MSPAPPVGPGGRPFGGWRIPAFVLGLVALGVNAVILLSDRAPGLFDKVSMRIDAGVSRAANATGVVPAARLPQSDFDVHLLIWAAAALLLGLAAWSWVALALAGGSVFALSVVMEVAQQTFTVSRTLQREDIAGNAVGVLCGVGAVAGFAVAWRMVSTRLSAPGP